VVLLNGFFVKNNNSIECKFFEMNISISIILVTYNATSITHLCLWSLAKSGLQRSEVILIDNATNDPYTEILARDYPFVKLIHNHHNEGFGKACNRGFKMAKGDLVLFLNPDTIVPPDFEKKILTFFQEHPNTGAMGVKMLDGQGNFLPESKRNFPFPLASLFKFIRLNKLIPDSRKKWHYYATHIKQNQTTQTEVLCGAFMVVSRTAMLKTGGFDPRYFLYAEDIDLSWQILQSDFEIWYNPNIRIIHFKGETTQKNSSYSKVFYESMEQFYHKYFNQKHNILKSFFIVATINIISILSLLKHKIKRSKPAKTYSNIELHADSCNETFEELKSFTHKKVTFHKPGKNFTKPSNRYILISTQKISPSDLIERINQSRSQKHSILLWHHPTNDLFKLNNADQNYEVISII
jgi:N-acetylglucosaminyl-diphospho-decaprenol L-rhamnosyltransferase